MYRSARTAWQLKKWGNLMSQGPTPLFPAVRALAKVLGGETKPGRVQFLTRTPEHCQEVSVVKLVDVEAIITPGPPWLLLHSIATTRVRSGMVKMDVCFQLLMAAVLRCSAPSNQTFITSAHVALRKVSPYDRGQKHQFRWFLNIIARKLHF